MKNHFNPENIFQRGDRFVYIDENGLEHDVTDQLVGWICSNGHKWQESLANRTKGAGCPMCEPGEKRILDS